MDDWYMRCEREHVAKAPFSLRGLAELHERHAKIVERLRETPLDGDRAAKCRDRFLKVARVTEQHPELVVRLGIVWMLRYARACGGESAIRRRIFVSSGHPPNAEERSLIPPLPPLE